MTTQWMERTAPASDMTETTANAETATTPATREESRYLAPPVDIYETDDALVVVADVPGAQRDDIDVTVENGILTLEARTRHADPEDVVWREFDLAPYHRRFRLNDAVDPERIRAELKHGVLRVHLPKAERLRPRRIDVQIG